MSIRKGDKAPGFELPNKPGEAINVGDSIGREPVVLLFFPLAFSSVCTDEMCQMRDSWDKWKQLGAKVFGITVDSPFITEKFRNDLNIPFPILSDFNRTVARKFDVLHPDLVGLKDIPKRSAFVIGADGTVVYDWVSEDPKKMPDFEAVQGAVSGLSAAGAAS